MGGCESPWSVSATSGASTGSSANPSPSASSGRTTPVGRSSVSLQAGAATESEPIVLYDQRWVQLGLLALLALVSDLVCFAVAAAPASWEHQFNHEPSALIDIFLFTNVLSCFAVTDITRLVGLRRAVTGAALLMSAGCALRSGIPLAGGLPPYTYEVVGTVLVGAAQPFFQCTPPLLSATWFGADERALSTAIAINFNQVGIGSAFLLGGALGQSSEGLNTYFGVVTIASVVLSIATVLRFQEAPPTPPSQSAASKSAANPPVSSVFTFPKTAAALLRTPGFLTPLAAFVTSIAVSNVISAFTEQTLGRAGFEDQRGIDLAGAGFQLAIVLGGIVVGGYVDRTKEYKRVTLACLTICITLLSVLGIAFGYDLNLPHWVVILALLGLGASAGPVQPINAELAVEVSYPVDENSVEAVQQLCGNLFSALLVPLCENAANFDLALFPGLGPDEDMRGDTAVLIALSLATLGYFSSFDAALKRSEVDSALDD